MSSLRTQAHIENVKRSMRLAEGVAQSFAEENQSEPPHSILLGAVANDIADDVFPIVWDRFEEGYSERMEEAWHDVQNAALVELRRLLPECAV